MFEICCEGESKIVLNLFTNIINFMRSNEFLFMV